MRKLKVWLSALLVLCLILANIPPVVFAQTEPESIPVEEAIPEEEIPTEAVSEERIEVDPIPDPWSSHRDIPTRTLDANGVPAVTSTPQVKWIDRLDNPPAYVRELYDWLVENSDGDGVDDALIDPTTLDLAYNQYYAHTVVELKGLKVTYSHSGSNLNAAGSAAVEADRAKQKKAFVGYLVAAYAAFSRDYAGIFWFGGTGYYLTIPQSETYTDQGGGKGVATYGLKFAVILQEPGYFDVREEGYRDPAVIYNTIRERDNLVKNITAQATGTRYEKIRFLNSWLTAHNGYNTTELNADLSNISYDCRNCMNALRGRAGTGGPVCEGYTRAMKMLCDDLKIPCVLVDGIANGGNHIWNYVQMEDGNWYAVDVTWNDPFVSTSNPITGAENENYLLIGKNTNAGGRLFSASHIVTNEVYPTYTKFLNGPVLSAERYVYTPGSENQPLTIVSQPKSVVSTPGSTVTFSVAAQGYGLTYQWKYKNAADTTFRNTTLPGNQTSMLTVSDLDGTNHNGRQYKCVIKDANGTQVETSVATLEVAYIISNAKDQTVTPGSNAIFSVKYSITKGVTYQWQFMRNDGSNSWANTTASGNKTNTLTVTAKASYDGYKYRCVITDPNFADPFYSKVATLTVEDQSFAITAQPQSQTVKPDVSVSFKVTARGSGLSYKWYYRNAGETAWRTTSLTGYNTNTLTIAKVVGATHNGRQYMCKITTAEGTVVETEPATLTVAYIINDAKSQSTAIGGNAVFTVKYSDIPGVTYRWQYKGNTASSTWANTSATGNKTNTLTVQGKSTNNRYMYRCVITDPNFAEPFYSKEVYLNIVEDHAKITTEPTATAVVSGNYAYFTVAAEGNGITYNWQWSNDGISWSTTKSSGYNTATVRVKTNNFIDGRYYRCQVKTYNGNSYNTVNSRAVQLTVLPAAAIIEAPQNMTVKAGRQATFSVVAEGEGLTYQWQWAKFKGNWKNTSMTGATTATLTTNPVTADMNGRYYRVVITNKFGGYVETAAVQLTVK